MNRPKLTQVFQTSTGMLLLPFLLMGSLPMQAQNVPPPPSGPNPTSTAGAGTRGGPGLSCLNPLDQPQAILTTEGQTTVLKFVVEDDLDFTWYIPNTDAELAELTLQDANENSVYTTELILPIEPEVFEVELPSINELGQQLLAEDQQYTWVLAIACDDFDRTQDQIVQGDLLRLSPEVLPDHLKSRQ